MRARVIGMIGIGLAMALVTIATAGNEGKATTNPYEAIYATSIQGMAAPDQTLDGVMPPNAPVKVAEALAPQSKTCSQRCSTTCSRTCTTTRGCSSNCKKQTDGCGGGAVTQPQPAAPPVRDASPLGTRAAVDPNLATIANAQRALVIEGYEGLCIDGALSPATRQALVAFQRSRNITADGAFNADTWIAFRAVLSRVYGS